MLVKKWENLPIEMQKEPLRAYYSLLRKKNLSLFFKRIFDIVVSFLMLILLSPLFLVLAVIIKCNSSGEVFFRQERVTQYGKIFRIFKFRTMVKNADKIGDLVTSKGDSRVTSVGKKLRKYRLDELPQLLNVFMGQMTFVGPRPEVLKYVNHYTEEMAAVLLIPAGVTSEASILYKDEEKYMTNATDADAVYINVVMPEKMVYNLMSIKNYSFFKDIKTMFKTVIAVFK